MIVGLPGGAGIIIVPRLDIAAALILTYCIKLYLSTILTIIPIPVMMQNLSKSSVRNSSRKVANFMPKCIFI